MTVLSAENKVALDVLTRIVELAHSPSAARTLRGHRVVALAQTDWPCRSGRAEAEDPSSQPMGSASRSTSAGPHEPFG